MEEKNSEVVNSLKLIHMRLWCMFQNYKELSHNTLTLGNVKLPLT